MTIFQCEDKLHVDVISLKGPHATEPPLLPSGLTLGNEWYPLYALVHCCFVLLRFGKLYSCLQVWLIGTVFFYLAQCELINPEECRRISHTNPSGGVYSWRPAEDTWRYKPVPLVTKRTDVLSEVTKPRDSCFTLFPSFYIWQTPRQHCCQCLSNFRAIHPL